MKKYETIELDIEKEIEQIMFDRESLMVLNKIKVEILNFVKENLIGKRINQYKKYTQLLREHFENHKDIKEIEYRKNDYSCRKSNHCIEISFIPNKELQQKYKFDYKSTYIEIHNFYFDKDKGDYIQEEEILKKIENLSGLNQHKKEDLEDKFDVLFSKIDEVNQIVKTINRSETHIGGNDYIHLCNWDRERQLFKNWNMK